MCEHAQFMTTLQYLSMIIISSQLYLALVLVLIAAVLLSVPNLTLQFPVSHYSSPTPQILFGTSIVYMPFVFLNPYYSSPLSSV